MLHPRSTVFTTHHLHSTQYSYSKVAANTDYKSSFEVMFLWKTSTQLFALKLQTNITSIKVEKPLNQNKG